MTKRAIFPAKYAEMLKDRAGEKYEPSNGTEGMIFEETFCHDCKRHDLPCREIWGNALFLTKDHANYPKELTYTAEGQPTCTAFEELPRFIVKGGILHDRLTLRYLEEVPAIESMGDAADFLNSIIDPPPHYREIDL